MTKLSSDQTELLYNYSRMDGEAELVAKDDLDAVKNILADALRERGVSNPESLDISALAAQFSDPQTREQTVDKLSQQPETGSGPVEAGRSDPREKIANLSAKEAEDVYHQTKKIRALEGRTPKHVENLKAYLAAEIGIDKDELPDVKEIQKILGKR